MDFQSPTCLYCQQMYSRYNEPIFIVCLCDEIAKHAHGSCFREFLKSHDYGVCGHCLEKTRIIPDGFKPVGEWKCPMLKPICGIWRRFLTDNRYWKVVYCREERSKKSNRVIRLYSDVPDRVPWEKSTIRREQEKEEFGFETSPQLKEVEFKKTQQEIIEKPGEDEKDHAINFTGFKIPTVFVPRGYPYVKKKVEYEDGERQLPKFDDHFDYYPSIDRLSVDEQDKRSWIHSSGRSYSSARSMTSDRETYPSDNASTDALHSNNSDINSDSSNISSTTDLKENSNKKSRLKFFRNSKEKMQETQTSSKTKRKPSNNNTVHHKKDGDETSNNSSVMSNNKDSNIAVTPLQNDIIFMTSANNDASVENASLEIKSENARNNKKNKKNKKHKNNKNKNEKKKEGQNLYGMNTNMFKPVIHAANTPEPSVILNERDFAY